MEIVNQLKKQNEILLTEICEIKQQISKESWIREEYNPEFNFRTENALRISRDVEYARR
jgi:hypothetical protein